MAERLAMQHDAALRAAGQNGEGRVGGKKVGSKSKGVLSARVMMKNRREAARVNNAPSDGLHLESLLPRAIHGIPASEAWASTAASADIFSASQNMDCSYHSLKSSKVKQC